MSTWVSSFRTSVTQCCINAYYYCELTKTIQSLDFSIDTTPVSFLLLYKDLSRYANIYNRLTNERERERFTKIKINIDI